MDEQVTREPVLLQRIDYDREGRLVLILNQHVTNEWVRDLLRYLRHRVFCG